MKFEKMKKKYFEPTTDVVKLDYTNALLAGSIGDDTEGGGSDGGATITPSDPSQAGWGDDY